MIAATKNVADARPTKPSLVWYILSAITLFITGSISKIFLCLARKVEVHGFDEFIKLLDGREDVARRKRGLLTVANHISTVDDPLIWGLLPYRHLLPNNCRWALGSYDICYTINNFFSAYFMMGQTMPTHRLKYSRDGGLFQPTMTQCIRLLSRGPFTEPTPKHPDWNREDFHANATYCELDEVLENPTETYTTTGTDHFQAPSAYGERSHAWVHIFPEGRINQHPELQMQYFRWGVARLILESEPCPMVVPMWIEGTDQVKNESVERFYAVPRIFGRTITTIFGEPVHDSVWTIFRRRWKALVAKEFEKEFERSGWVDGGAIPDEFFNDELRFGVEAQKLRMEVARVVQDQVMALRRQGGWPEQKLDCGVPPKPKKRKGYRRVINNDIKTTDEVWT